MQQITVGDRVRFADIREHDLYGFGVAQALNDHSVAVQFEKVPYRYTNQPFNVVPKEKLLLESHHNSSLAPVVKCGTVKHTQAALRRWSELRASRGNSVLQPRPPPKRQSTQRPLQPIGHRRLQRGTAHLPCHLCGLELEQTVLQLHLGGCLLRWQYVQSCLSAGMRRLPHVPSLKLTYGEKDLRLLEAYRREAGRCLVQNAHVCPACGYSFPFPLFLDHCTNCKSSPPFSQSNLPPLPLLHPLLPPPWLTSPDPFKGSAEPSLPFHQSPGLLPAGNGCWGYPQPLRAGPVPQGQGQLGSVKAPHPPWPGARPGGDRERRRQYNLNNHPACSPISMPSSICQRPEMLLEENAIHSWLPGSPAMDTASLPLMADLRIALDNPPSTAVFPCLSAQATRAPTSLNPARHSRRSFQDDSKHNVSPPPHLSEDHSAYSLGPLSISTANSGVCSPQMAALENPNAASSSKSPSALRRMSDGAQHETQLPMPPHTALTEETGNGPVFAEVQAQLDVLCKELEQKEQHMEVLAQAQTQWHQPSQQLDIIPEQSRGQNQLTSDPVSESGCNGTDSQVQDDADKCDAMLCTSQVDVPSEHKSGEMNSTCTRLCGELDETTATVERLWSLLGNAEARCRKWEQKWNHLQQQQQVPSGVPKSPPSCNGFRRRLPILRHHHLAALPWATPVANDTQDSLELPAKEKDAEECDVENGPPDGTQVYIKTVTEVPIAQDGSSTGSTSDIEEPGEATPSSPVECRPASKKLSFTSPTTETNIIDLPTHPAGSEALESFSLATTPCAQPAIPSQAHQGMTTLLVAALHSDVQDCQALLSIQPNVHLLHDANGRTALHWAAEGGHADALQCLLETPSSSNASSAPFTSFQDSKGRLPLHIAAAHNSAECIPLLLSHGTPADVNTPDSQGRRPIHLAIRKGAVDAALALIEHGALVDVPEAKSQAHPLHVAAHLGSASMCQALCSHVADINVVVSNTGRTALHIACHQGHAGVAQLLLEKGADPMCKAMNPVGWLPLHMAAHKGHHHCISVLLDHTPDRQLCCTTSKGNTALHLACMRGHTECVQELLHHLPQSLLGHPNAEGTAALHFAVHGAHTECVKLLLRHKADVMQSAALGWTALHWAVLPSKHHQPSCAIIDLLIEAKAEPDTQSTVHGNALHLAAHVGNTSATKALILGGASMECRDLRGLTALHIAVLSNSVASVAALIENGADLSSASLKTGDTAAHLCCTFGHTDVLALLCSASCDLLSYNKAGHAPLHLAAQHSEMDCAEILLKTAKVPIDQLSASEDVTPLYAAIIHNQCDAARALLRLGANAKFRTSKYFSALHCAVETGQLGIIKVLLDEPETGVQGVVDEEGNTVLHYCATDPSMLDIVRLLLVYGGDLCHPNTQGQTPVHLACVVGNHPLITWLLEDHEELTQNTSSSSNSMSMANVKLQCRRMPAEVWGCVDRQGQTPLFMAALYGHEAILSTLLANLVALQFIDQPAEKMKYTPLMAAVVEGHLDAACLLLNYGANPNALTHRGQTVLHLACHMPEMFSILQRLLKDPGNCSPSHHSADLEAVDIEGNTPLHYASAIGNVEAIHLLLDMQADPNAHNSSGVTPIMQAKSSGVAEALQLFSRY